LVDREESNLPRKKRRIEQKPSSIPDPISTAITKSKKKKTSSTNNTGSGVVSSLQDGSALPDTSKLPTITFIYNLINQETQLLFGVDKDILSLPLKRKSRKTNILGASEAKMMSLEDIEDLKYNSNDIPFTVSPGYGEITQGGFSKLISYCQKELPKQLRMTKDSSFVDIGSGYGKCVFHCSLQVQLKASVGIEYMALRHQKAVKLKEDLVKKFPHNSHWKTVNFFERDATHIKDFSMFSHIYMFDWIFTQETHSRILPNIERSNFKIFICFSSPKKLEGFGCTKFDLLKKLEIVTTGNQKFTAYFYKKK